MTLPLATVQRRRGDIRHYLNADTLFLEREEQEESYQLSKEYKRFFDRVLRYARETVADDSGGRFRQRVRWWSALALLRTLSDDIAPLPEPIPRLRFQGAERWLQDEKQSNLSHTLVGTFLTSSVIIVSPVSGNSLRAHRLR